MGVNFANLVAFLLFVLTIAQCAGQTLDRNAKKNEEKGTVVNNRLPACIKLYSAKWEDILSKAGSDEKEVLSPAPIKDKIKAMILLSCNSKISETEIASVMKEENSTALLGIINKFEPTNFGKLFDEDSVMELTKDENDILEQEKLAKKNSLEEAPISEDRSYTLEELMENEDYPRCFLLAERKMKADHYIIETIESHAGPDSVAFKLQAIMIRNCLVKSEKWLKGGWNDRYTSAFIEINYSLFKRKSFDWIPTLGEQILTQAIAYMEVDRERYEKLFLEAENKKKKNDL